MINIIEKLRKFRDDRNWSQFHTPKDLAISTSIEAAELLEVFQWKPAEAPLDKKMIDQVANEAADVFLYLLFLCDAVGIDLVAAANQKIDRNELRFPVSTSRGVASPQDMSK